MSQTRSQICFYSNIANIYIILSTTEANVTHYEYSFCDNSLCLFDFLTVINENKAYWLLIYKSDYKNGVKIIAMSLTCMSYVTIIIQICYTASATNTTKM